MKKILIFVLFLIGCSEEHVIEKKICNPFRMTISDALPVQFWVNGVETYNQKEVCGINSVCFCQPFNCSDEIRIQFQADGVRTYSLSILDSLSNEITSLSFSNIAENTYELSFVPSELDICDEQIQLKIIRSDISSINDWTEPSNFSGGNITSLVYGNGVWVAVKNSDGTRIYYSTDDGVTWSASTGSNLQDWTSVTYSESLGLFVAVAENATGTGVATSNDGVTWTYRTYTTDNDWQDVKWIDDLGLFVAVANTGTTSDMIMTSPNGVEWTNRTTPVNKVWKSIAYGNGVIVVIASTTGTNTVLTSTDGITWVASNSGDTSKQWHSITFGEDEGLFVAVAISTGYVMVSEDGLTWTTHAVTNLTWRHITYGDGLFVAVSSSGTGNRSMSSVDGINWTQVNTVQDINWYWVSYGNGFFIAGANDGAPSESIMIANALYEDTVVANSDCIDIKTSHDCTALIRYDNAKDFAGLEYSSFSPTAEFYLRIPAVFFHERNTEEEENFEESTENIVRLRNEIKLKKLLEVGFMPDYMHRKLLLILAHDTVEIDGESWIKRDPYEKEEPGNKRYPLKKASVLLTQKDYIKRNIL